MSERVTSLSNDEACDPAVRELIALAKQERMPAKQASAVAAALGIGATVTTTTSAAAATGAVASGLLTKIVLGVGLLAASVGGYALVRASGTESSNTSSSNTSFASSVGPVDKAQVAASSSLAPSANDIATQREASVHPAAAQSSPVAATVEVVKPSPPTRTPATKPSSPTPSLADEVALLDEANLALTNRDFAKVTSLLARHRATFTKPHLPAVALALTFDFAVARNDLATARKLAAQFAERFPQSPVASRIARTASSLPSEELQ